MTAFLMRLPYPPSNNRYYRHQRGNIHISPEGLRYRQEVLAMRPRKGWPLEGPVSLEIRVYPQRAVSQDLDNIPKCICDSLQFAKLYRNDSQIELLTVERMGKVLKAYVEIVLAPRL